MLEAMHEYRLRFPVGISSIITSEYITQNKPLNKNIDIMNFDGHSYTNRVWNTCCFVKRK